MFDSSGVSHPACSNVGPFSLETTQFVVAIVLSIVLYCSMAVHAGLWSRVTVGVVAKVFGVRGRDGAARSSSRDHSVVATATGSASGAATAPVPVTRTRSAGDTSNAVSNDDEPFVGDDKLEGLAASKLQVELETDEICAPEVCAPNSVIMTRLGVDSAVESR